MMKVLQLLSLVCCVGIVAPTTSVTAEMNPASLRLKGHSIIMVGISPLNPPDQGEPADTISGTTRTLYQPFDVL